MAQINLNTTPDFDADLASLMRWRGFVTKSAAIRFAVRQASLRHRLAQCKTLFELRDLFETLPPEMFGGPEGDALAGDIRRRTGELAAVQADASAEPGARGN